MNIDEMIFKIDNTKRFKKMLKAVKKLGGNCEVKLMNENQIDFSVSFNPEKPNFFTNVIGFHE